MKIDSQARENLIAGFVLASLLTVVGTLMYFGNVDEKEKIKKHQREEVAFREMQEAQHREETAFLNNLAVLHSRISNSYPNMIYTSRNTTSFPSEFKTWVVCYLSKNMVGALVNEEENPKLPDRKVTVLNGHFARCGFPVIIAKVTPCKSNTIPDLFFLIKTEALESKMYAQYIDRSEVINSKRVESRLKLDVYAILTSEMKLLKHDTFTDEGQLPYEYSPEYSLKVSRLRQDFVMLFISSVVSKNNKPLTEPKGNR